MKVRSKKSKSEILNTMDASLEPTFATTFKKMQEKKNPTQIVETCFTEILGEKHI